MPVRKIPPNALYFTGRQALKRLKHSVAFESFLERDFLTLLDFDRDVAAVEEQPVRIDWQDAKGRSHRYTPDFLVTFLPSRDQLPAWQRSKRKPWLVEVKPEAVLKEDWSKLRPKFRAAIRFAREKGWTFHIMTERRIRTVRLDNARFLLPAMMLPYNKQRCEALLKVLENCGELTAAQLLAATCQDPINQAMSLSMLWSLVAWRNIGADLSRPLNMNTLLWLPEYMPRMAA